MKTYCSFLAGGLIVLSGCNTTTPSVQVPVSAGPQILVCSVKDFTQSGKPDLEFQRKNKLKTFKIDLSAPAKITVYTFSKEFRDSTKVYTKRSDTGSFFSASIPKHHKVSLGHSVKVRKSPNASGVYSAEISIGSANSDNSYGFENVWFLVCGPAE